MNCPTCETKLIEDGPVLAPSFRCPACGGEWVRAGRVGRLTRLETEELVVDRGWYSHRRETPVAHCREDLFDWF